MITREVIAEELQQCHANTAVDDVEQFGAARCGHNADEDIQEFHKVVDEESNNSDVLATHSGSAIKLKPIDSKSAKYAVSTVAVLDETEEGHV